MFSTVNIAYYSFLEEKLTNDNEVQQFDKNIQTNETTKLEEIEYTLNDEFKDNWYIEIPEIQLMAPIAEGTTQEVMSKYVGHFENTTVWEGNIGLAAHNRRMSSKLF